MQLLDTGDLHDLPVPDPATLVAPGLRGWSVDDVQGERMLIDENPRIRPEDPMQFNLFTVRLSDGVRSPRAVMRTEGRFYLTPAGDRIVANETRTLYTPDGKTITGRDIIGRLHVYDVATGAKLGEVGFPLHVSGAVDGIRPQGDKLYFYSYATRPEEMTISVLSLVNFTLLKELVVPAGVLYLFETAP